MTSINVLLEAISVHSEFCCLKFLYSLPTLYAIDSRCCTSATVSLIVKLNFLKVLLKQ